MKKGFTLIELLAVIIILAVIALILTPVIMGIVDKASESAVEQSLNSYIESANNAAAISLVDSSKGISVTNDKHTFVTGTDDATLSKIEISGIAPTYIYLDYDATTKEISIGHFCIKGYSIDYDGSTSISSNNYCGTIPDEDISNTSSTILSTIMTNEYIYLSLEGTTETVSWSSSNSAIAKVNESGRVVGVSEGTATITAISGKKTVQYNIKVAKGETECRIYYKWTYDYSGNYVVFTSPCDANYKIELWGASGASTGYAAGKGSYVTGTIKLKQGDKLLIAVGGAGNGTSGGYNGGGIGRSSTGSSGGGGGATDIRLINGDLYSRLMVAGGGGGAAYYKTGIGGSGGTLVGLNGTVDSRLSSSYAPAQGGSQISGGSKSSCGSGYCGNEASGTFGVGGAASSFSGYPGGGGGGGYYGGGGGASGYAYSGAGGSSYISGYKGAVAILSSTSTSPRKDSNGTECTASSALNDITCSYHYSGLVFTDTSMIDGNTSMPTHDGTSIMIGNSGNGYAKITLISY